MSSSTPSNINSTNFSERTPPHDQQCRVDDFINIFKLEQFMNNLIVKLDNQQEQIHRLEAALATKAATNESLQSMSSTLVSRVTAVEEAMIKWTSTISRVEKALNVLESSNSRLTDIETNLDQKADLHIVNEIRLDLEDRVALQYDDIVNTRATVSAVKNIEDSQHAILQECVALQHLLACKVDKAEVPSLLNASERVQKANEFVDLATPKLAQLEGAILHTARAVSLKEDRDSVTARLDDLSKDMDEKLEQQVYASKSQEDIFRKEMKRQQASLDQISKSYSKLDQGLQLLEAYEKGSIEAQATSVEVKKHIKEIAMDVANLTKEVALLPSHEVMLHYIDDAKTKLDNDIVVVEERCAHDIQIHNDLLLEIRTQLLELARHHATVEQKLGVSMKFVDWFTDVKLKENSFNRPM